MVQVLDSAPTAYHDEHHIKYALLFSVTDSTTSFGCTKNEYALHSSSSFHAMNDSQLRNVFIFM